MALFSKLFGGGATPTAEAETYKDFSITAAPEKATNGWRIAAVIEKDGKTHKLIRADVLNSKDDADAASISKAKQMIDEQGERVFD